MKHALKIRSITIGTPCEAGPTMAVDRAGRLLATISERFLAAGYEVQTTRVSLPPLTRLGLDSSGLTDLAADLDAAAAAAGMGYVALGPIRWRDDPEQAAALADSLPSALARSRSGSVFGSVETADDRGVRFAAVEASATIIRTLAESTEDGFGNLRFAALAKCPPGIPFFPAAYHSGPELTFGLALQAADLAVDAFERAESLAEAEAGLTASVETELLRLEQVAAPLEAELGIRYAGADPTLAPFPDERESIGAALERLGVGAFGAAGTLTAAALVTSALRAARGRRCGFSGLMLPVLEDPVLARGAAEQRYSWEELLLYSAVCGTGLDTVPLPGDISRDELAAIILDVASLAVTLQKPLTCRLLPVPGKAAGEPTSFDFPYFANGGVLPTKGIGSPLLIRRGLAAQRT